MHPEWTALLSAYLDDELDLTTRRRVDEHLATCAACAGVLAELRGVVVWARRYEGRPPPRDPWPAIRARIDASKVVPLALAAKAAGGGRRFGWGQLIAAGLAMAAVGGGSVWLVLRGRGAAPEVEVAPAVVQPAALGDDDLAVRDLEELLAAGRGQLDSATVRVIEESLAVIDQAIAEARLAIQRDSTNAYLSSRIAAHMRQKLAILRMAARAIGAES
jgi:hypothetical protein